MKRVICSLDENKYEKYNYSKTETGSALKTLKGSTIKRSRYGVGKEIGGKIYAHTSYIYDIVGDNLAKSSFESLHRNYPGFTPNCFNYEYSTDIVTFQEAPEFDLQREPVVGKQVKVYPDGTVGKMSKFYNQIWHHKWLWVKNSYTGFNVRESWEWSREWLSKLNEPADGSNEINWENQLSKYGLN